MATEIEILKQVTLATLVDAEACRGYLLDLTVARWGEAEREPRARQLVSYTPGLLANALAAECVLADVVGADMLLRAARKLLTSADKAQLRKGG